MRRSVFALAVLLTASFLLAGCAVISSHEEYTAYRSVRMADSDRDRLIAMQRYVEHHPGGYWIEEIQADRESREGDLWANSNSTREGLEWYLQVYPDGQYVEQARPRLAALQTVNRGRDEEAERQRELEAQQRAQAAEDRRTWVTRAVQFWTRQMIGIRNYGSSIQRVVGANADFSRAFGQAPTPSCSPDYCIKHYGQLYHIPVPGATRIDRHIDVYLRLVLVNGRVERTELLLPNKGFSRWYEMENQTVVTDEDPEQRQMAINWALDRIQPIIEEVARGLTRIDDFVPEPIEPLQVAGDSEDTEAAPVAPDQEAPAAEGAAQKQDGSEEPPDSTGDSALDALLDDAADSNEEPETPPEVPAQPPAAATMVLPINLMTFRVRNVRVGLFAAGDEDYEQGYDGLFVERIRAGQ